MYQHFKRVKDSQRRQPVPELRCAFKAKCRSDGICASFVQLQYETALAMATRWRWVLRLNCLEVRINWWLWEPPSVLSAPWIWCNQDRTWSKKKERKKKGFTTLSSLSFPHLSFINTHNQTSDTLRYNPIKYVEWTLFTLLTINFFFW